MSTDNNRNKLLFPLSKVDPDDTKIDLTCSSAKIILLYLRKKLGEETTQKLIYETGMNLDYLENRNNWISFPYYCRLLAKVTEYIKDPNALFEAGTFASEDSCYGPVQAFITRALNVTTMYKLAIQLARRFSHLGEIKLLKTTHNSCTVQSIFHKHKQDRNNCICFQGVFAAIPRVHGLPIAKVKDIQCMCDGADSCIYEFKCAETPNR